jgi:hypothetical protein
VLTGLPRPGYVPLPDGQYASARERRLDIDCRAGRIGHRLSHTGFLYGTLPVAFPDRGPGIYLICDASGIGGIPSSLSPGGVCFGDITGITDRGSAAAFVSRVEKRQLPGAV